VTLFWDDIVAEHPLDVLGLSSFRCSLIKIPCSSEKIP